MPLSFRILPSARASGRGAGAGPSAANPAFAEGPSEERVFELLADAGEVRIGRAVGVEIELPFPGVSLAHARLFRGDLPGDWWIEDLGSTNGCWIDGQRLSSGRPVALRRGQRLRVATVDVVFEGWSPSARGAESTASIARRLIGDLFGAMGSPPPTLTVEAGAGPAAPATLRLAERDRRYVVGRAETCDLALPVEHVSREHAVFVSRADGVHVIDLGSRNGVRVNGETSRAAEAAAAAGPRDVLLADGDRIVIGSVTLRLTDAEDRYRRSLAAVEDNAPAAPSESPSEPPPPSVDAFALTAPSTSPRPPEPAAAPPEPPIGSTSPAPPSHSGHRLAIALAATAIVLALAGLVALIAAS